MITSKLPDVGTTIFTVMSHRAAQLGALNIGQGFPDYPIDPKLAAALTEAVAAGHDQYAPMEGSSALREAIAAKLRASHELEVDPVDEITVTCGATEALYSAIQAVVGPGDEAIVFDPAYDSYDPAIRLAGGRAIHIPLAPPRFRYDWERVRAAITPRTRLLILNTPLNPACTVARAGDLAALAELLRERPIALLADEVYEHVIFDGRRHESALAHPELRAKSFVVFSFGKALHATGWRIGYCVAPRALTAELRKVHQYNTFSIAAPLQAAIARYLPRHPESWQGLAAYFEAKRDRLVTALAGSGFGMQPAEGTYFQLLDFSAIAPAESDSAFATRLLEEGGVATIPLSPFYRDPPRLSFVRVCVAKLDATLDVAAERLRAFAGRPTR
ncbi:MAG TPA: methionine aminotransferase [Steroidobacteraceae bacterium]|nr:methionine aminotransferase [Steroidobacteraceae bacterium]